MVHTVNYLDNSMADKDHGKFDYFPAGVFTPNHQGLAIYIKYRRNPDAITLVSQSPRHAHFRCPDRDLMMVGDTHYAQPYNLPFDYDEVVNLSPIWPTTGSEGNHLPGWMANYTQYTGKEHLSPNMREHGRKPHHKQTILSDSGGFQIRNERVNFIDPYHLIDWYNKNVDIGIVLDFPPAHLHWPGSVEMYAKAQRRATDILLANKRDDLDLMNVFHGRNMEEIRIHREIVEVDEIDRVCIGGIYDSAILQAIHNATQIILSGRKYPHYHFLGVSNIRQLYLVMRMAANGIADYITSDSSTWLQEGLNKGYYVWPSVTEPPRYYKIGDKTNRPNSAKILPCSCQVCRAVKYQDIFSTFSGNVLSFVMAHHNMYAFSSLTKAMFEIIRDGSLADVKEVVRKQFVTRTSGRDEVLAGFDYVDTVASDGIDSAAAKSSYFLVNQESALMLPAGGLFSTNLGYDEEEEEEYVDPEEKRKVDRMKNILNTYIGGELTGPGKRGVDKVSVKKRIRKESGHSKTSANAVRVPGSGRKVKMVVKK